MSKIISGKVVHSKMPKTLVVEIEYKKAHPLYKKIIKKSRKLKAHYEKGNFNKGDEIMIKETKPISKTKHWIVIENNER